MPDDKQELIVLDRDAVMALWLEDKLQAKLLTPAKAGLSTVRVKH